MLADSSRVSQCGVEAADEGSFVVARDLLENRVADTTPRRTIDQRECFALDHLLAESIAWMITSRDGSVMMI